MKQQRIVVYIMLAVVGFLVCVLVFFGMNRIYQKKVISSLSSVPVSRTHTVIPTSAPLFRPAHVSTEQIFSNDHSWTATLPAERVRTLIATGDVIPARSVNYKTISYGNFHWAWEKTADLLRSSDFTLINLESPILEHCPTTNEGMTFCGDKRHIEGLQFAGVDAANMGNNHAGNYGEEGVEETAALLHAAGILPIGIQNPVYRDIRGMKFAFLGYNDIGRQPGVGHIEDETFTKEIQEASLSADVVIVSVHWGVEYTHEPTDRQIETGHAMIDAGADVVIGNHPHWVQPVELYKKGLIMYAHGNFIFDQMWSRETREGVVGKYTFYDDTLVDVEFFPVVIEDYGQPRWAEGDEKATILQGMKPFSGI